MCDKLHSASIWGWRGAASGIGQRLQHIFETEERSDVEFAVGHQYGKEQVEFFQAHKLVLGISSDVFDSMFYGGIRETTEKTIELPDILPDAFAVMLKYLYTDIVEDLNLDNVLATIYCAQKYGIPKLVDICVDYAIKNVDKSTVFTMLEAAEDLGADNVVSKCLEMVDTQCSELLRSPEFLEVKNETLRKIFSRDTLMANEEEVYKAAERWACDACRRNELRPTAANYRFLLGEALFMVRFPLMNDTQLANGPLTNGLLLNEEVLKIYQFRHGSMKPDIPFSDVPRTIGINFCDRPWIVLETSDNIAATMTRTASNVFVDEQGRLHLRYAQHDGVWKGAGIRSADSLGFGRYEFHIEGLHQLGSNVGFAMCSQARHEPGVWIYSIEDVSGDALSSFHITRTSFRRQSSPLPQSVAHSNKTTTMCEDTVYSYHRKSDSVSFSCQPAGADQRSSILSRLREHKWSYESRPTISLQALPVFVFLSAPLDGCAKDVEVVVRSFRFYPDN